MISYIDVDLKKEIIEDMSKIMEEIRQKFIENTGIPMNRLQNGMEIKSLK